ncbi:MAG TPA: ParB/RepB/Spo0J family partition protein [Methanoregulaceae archaeon]|jgi:PRTRC genetic system ParB family protein|nr:ParB/RepB/Spo0J family partition protein [Methanoregulaceae archaeon]
MEASKVIQGAPTGGVLDGADDLFGKMEESYLDIPINKLRVNDYNARKFHENLKDPVKSGKFDSLCASVRRLGYLQAILVRPVEGGSFEVVAGERRYHAGMRIVKEDSLDPGSFTIPSVVRSLDDNTAFDAMISENGERDDLTPYEEAQSLRDRIERDGNTDDALMDLSARTGIKPHLIRQKMAWLDMPEQVIDAWKTGKITAGHVQELTRLAEREKVLKFLTDALKERLTIRELRDRIANDAPLLEYAKFDMTSCGTCSHNSGLQDSLFQTDAKSKCLNPRCYREKQKKFFSENWANSKAKEMFSTSDYRIKDELPAGSYEVVKGDSADRCRECASHVTVLTLHGAIVEGMSRVCTGPKDCHAEIYHTKKAKNGDAGKGKDSRGKAPEKEKQGCAVTRVTDEKKQEEKRALKRGLYHREEFYKDIVPQKVAALQVNSPETVRLMMVALVLASSEAKTMFREKTGINMTGEKERYVERIFSLPKDELLPLLRDMSTVTIMSNTAGAQTYSETSSPKVRHLVAQFLGVDLTTDWVVNKNFLDSMTKEEIVKFGEDERHNLWKNESVKAYLEKNHPKKALMALKKSELIDVVLKSGIELHGMTPDEMISCG